MISIKIFNNFKITNHKFIFTFISPLTKIMLKLPVLNPKESAFEIKWCFDFKFEPVQRSNIICTREETKNANKDCYPDGCDRR